MKRILLSALSVFIWLLSIHAQDLPSPPERTGTPGIPGLEADSRKASQADADILITPMSEGLAAEQMVEVILGTGVNTSNISYTGSSLASGVFTNGMSTGIEFESGIILSSGWAQSLLGPNNSSSASNSNGLPGDADLSAIIGNSTYDASVLEFDFVPNTEFLTFNYVLFSEEYPEFLSFSDVFAFILDGTNIALIPGTTQPVAIGTVNHQTNASYYVDNTGGIYNVQADGFTTVFTASAMVTVGQTHHIKLAIADMSDHVYDSWVLIEGSSFSSLGSIIGTVVDNTSGQPIQDATVTATGSETFEATTNANGQYQLLNLPFGYGYEISAVAPEYEQAFFTGINVLQSDPVVQLDVLLDPISGNFDVTSLSPDPNPSVSRAMPNAKFVHRYYYVYNRDDNSPGVSIPVTVRIGSSDWIFLSDNKGIVDIAIPESLLPDAVGSVLNCQITTVINTPLDTPIDFQVQIIHPEYQKYWGEAKEASASFLNFHGGISSNSVTKLTESQSSNGYPEELALTLGDNAHIGIGASVGVEAMIKVNNFTAGGSAKADAETDVGIDEERGYKFDYISQSEKEALAKYYFYSKGNFDQFDLSLIRLFTVVEEYLVENYLVDDYFDFEKGGLVVRGQASASADLGFPVIPGLPMHLSADAEVHASASTSQGVMLDAQYNSSYYMGFAVDGGASASTDMMITLPKSNFTQQLEEKLSFFDQSISGDWHRGFSLVLSEDRVELALVRRNLHNETGWETVEKYTVTGEDVLYYFSSIDIIGSLVNYFEGQGVIEAVIQNTTYVGAIVQMFEILATLGSELASGDLMVEYETSRSDFSETIVQDLYIGFGIKALADISASLGGGKTVEKGRTKIIEQGEWLNFKHLPLVEYNTNTPDIGIEYEELVQEIIDDIPLYIRALYGAYKVIKFFSSFESAEELLVMDLGGGSSLEIETDYVPTGVDSIYCLTWGWYGDPGTTKSTARKSTNYDIYEGTKSAAQELYKMEYGIGGFYQFEPGGLTLNGTADLTIAYQEEELEDVDESRLAIYLEDKSNQKWEYVGGVVDQNNHSVRAPISVMGVYTVAPAIPDGEIVVHVGSDTIIADGVSTTLISTEPIQYNNQSLVDDGEVFTVFISHGTILDEDLDPDTDGIQLSSQSGVVQLELRSSTSGATSQISISSLKGYAEGNSEVHFLDQTAPAVPQLLLAEGVNGSIMMEWTPVESEDLAGYKVYFDPDSEIPPYNGLAKIQGSPSPITIGKDSTYTIAYLFEDSTYHVCMTAIDFSGNESGYSNVLTTSMATNQAPEVLNQELFFQDICNNDSQVGMLVASDPDGDDLSFSIVSGLNASIFEIDEFTGLVTMKTGPLNYRDEQNLIIEVTDNGPGKLSSNAILTIRTECYENHPPQVEDASFLLKEVDVSQGLVLGTIEAYEPDGGQTVSYHLVPEDDSKGFMVDISSGEIGISDVEQLNFGDYGECILRLVAMDNGEGWLTDTSWVTISYSPTSNRSLNLDPDLLIYPNPTLGMVYISSASMSSKVISLELYSMIGNRLLNSSEHILLNDRYALDLGSYLPGMYILRIIQEGEVQTAYIIKQ